MLYESSIVGICMIIHNFLLRSTFLEEKLIKDTRLVREEPQSRMHPKDITGNHRNKPYRDWKCTVFQCCSIWKRNLKLTSATDNSEHSMWEERRVHYRCVGKTYIGFAQIDVIPWFESHKVLRKPYEWVKGLERSFTAYIQRGRQDFRGANRRSGYLDADNAIPSW